MAKKVFAFLILVFAFLGLQSCSLENAFSINVEASPTVNTPVEDNANITSPAKQPVDQVFAATETPKCVVLTGIPDGTLNLRAGAGTEYPVLIVLAENDELDYLGQDNNGWKFVQVGDIRGWVFGQYVKECEE